MFFAYQKAAERMAQKKTGAVRSRSVNCECAQLLPGDRAGGLPPQNRIVTRPRGIISFIPAVSQLTWVILEANPDWAKLRSGINRPPKL